MKKKILLIIIGIVVLLFVIPLIINLFFTYGIFGNRPIVSVFNDSQWFSFWYTYIPAILAFSGTVFAVFVTVENNRKIVQIEKRNLLLRYMPKIAISKRLTIGRRDLKTIDPNSISKPSVESKVNGLVDKLERYRLKYNTEEECINVANWMIDILESFKNFQSTFTRAYKEIIGANIEDQMARKEIDDITNEMCEINEYIENNKARFDYMTLIERDLSKSVELKNQTSVKISVIDRNKLNQKIYFYRINLDFYNISNNDICNIKIISVNFNLLNNLCKINIHETVEVLIPQVEDIEEDNNLLGANVEIGFFSTRLKNFAYEKNLRIDLEYEVETAIGYKYKCSNSILASDLINSVSYANIKPVI